MSQIFSFYRLSDGQFTGDTYAGSDVQLALPDGCGFMPGRFNPSAHRVNMKTGKPESWRAPSPQADEFTAWEWADDQARWVAKLTDAGLSRAVRAERDSRLASCDWVVTRATELGTDVPPQWAAYRAALRALPQQPGFPNAVDWPASP